MSKRVVLAVDGGATSFKGYLVDEKLDVVSPVQKVLSGRESGPGPVLDAFAVNVETALRVGDFELCGIGAIVPGPADYKNGVIEYTPNLPGWAGCNVRREFEARFGPLPMGFVNDVAGATLGEFAFRVRQGWTRPAWVRNEAGERVLVSNYPIQSLLMAKIGGGVGGGYADRKMGMFPGTWGYNQTHIGHTVVPDPTPLIRRLGWDCDIAYLPRICGCGQIDHLEAHASCSAMAAIMQEMLDDGVETSVRDAWADAADKSRLIITAANEGDPASVAIMRYSAAVVAIGFLNGAMWMEPDVIVVGGGAVAHVAYVDYVREAYNALVPEPWTNMKQNVLVDGPLSGENDAIYGAGQLAWNAVDAA